MATIGNQIEYINSLTETLFDSIVNLDKSDVANIHQRNDSHILAIGDDPEDIHLRVGLRATGLDFICIEPHFHPMLLAWKQTATPWQIDDLQNKMLNVIAKQLNKLGYNYTDMHTNMLFTVGVPEFDATGAILLFITEHPMNWDNPDHDVLESILRKMVTMHTVGVDYLKDVFLDKLNDSK